MNLNEYIDNNKTETHEWLNKAVEMNDGFHVSIQCSEYHYSEPRSNTEAKFYRSFELGYPSEIDELISHLGEDKGTVETVFPYVERSVVEALIEKHGGIKGALVSKSPE